jgi:hypothetical protein
MIFFRRFKDGTPREFGAVPYYLTMSSSTTTFVPQKGKHRISQGAPMLFFFLEESYGIP